MNPYSFTDKEMFLMKAAFEAGNTKGYGSLEEWFELVIDDAGSIVVDHLAFDANRIESNPIQGGE